MPSTTERLTVETGVYLHNIFINFNHHLSKQNPSFVFQPFERQKQERVKKKENKKKIKNFVKNKINRHTDIYKYY